MNGGNPPKTITLTYINSNLGHQSRDVLLEACARPGPFQEPVGGYLGSSLSVLKRSVVVIDPRVEPWHEGLRVVSWTRVIQLRVATIN